MGLIPDIEMNNTPSSAIQHCPSKRLICKDGPNSYIITFPRESSIKWLTNTQLVCSSVQRSVAAHQFLHALGRGGILLDVNVTLKLSVLTEHDSRAHISIPLSKVTLVIE